MGDFERIVDDQGLHFTLAMTAAAPRHGRMISVRKSGAPRIAEAMMDDAQRMPLATRCFSIIPSLRLGEVSWVSADARSTDSPKRSLALVREPQVAVAASGGFGRMSGVDLVPSTNVNALRRPRRA